MEGDGLVMAPEIKWISPLGPCLDSTWEMWMMMQLRYFKFSLCYVFKTSAGVAGGFDQKGITDSRAFHFKSVS